MVSSAVPNEQEAIRQLLKRINQAWVQGRLEELNECFHENMVIVAPGLQAMRKGREACVRSYQEFIAAAVVHEYNEREPTIDLWANTAVAVYGWEIVYEINGQLSRESGQDLFVFARENGVWRAVWRTMLPSTLQAS
jgi:uncharacterized protein (TIGR02246 family)